MQTRTIAACSVVSGANVVAFEEGAMLSSTFVVEGTLVDTDGNVIPLDPAVAYTTKTTLGFTLNITTAGTFRAICAGAGTEEVDLSLNIVPLTTVKEYLHLTDTTNDAFLSRWIGIITSSIESYINGIVKQRNAAVIVNGSGTDQQEIPAPYLPIISMRYGTAADIQYKDKPTDSWTNLIMADFENIIIDAAYPSMITLYDDTFPYGFQNVKLALTVGYALVPQDFVSVCIEAVAEKWEESKLSSLGRLGMSSMSAAAVGNSGNNTFYQLSERHKDILNKYRYLV